MIVRPLTKAAPVIRCGLCLFSTPAGSVQQSTEGILCHDRSADHDLGRAGAAPPGCRSGEFSTTGFAQLIADMFETNDKANGVGLAAPQVGVGKRIFVYKYENEDGAPAEQASLVNPVLTLSKVSGALPDPDEEVEGCLSFPGAAVSTQAGGMGAGAGL